MKKTPGVIAYEVLLKSDSAIVLYDPNKLTLADLKQAIAETGFHVRGVQEIRE